MGPDLGRHLRQADLAGFRRGFRRGPRIYPAVLLAFGMLFPNAPLYLFFIPVPIKAKWMVIGMGVIELLIGLSEAAGKSDGVAHFAHLGGMIFGFFIIMYWKKKGTFHGGF